MTHENIKQVVIRAMSELTPEGIQEVLMDGYLAVRESKK